MKAFKRKDTLFLVPETDLIASQIEELRDFFVEQLKKHNKLANVTFNAEKVDIVDSLGVNLIIGLYKQVSSESKRFQIINAGEDFLKVAHFFRFQTLFDVSGKEDKE